jgi:mannose-6-phosphate isomerase-like protein (cupin superfamily)
MAVPTVIAPGGGEIVGDSPERRVEILCDDDAVHVTWSRFAPGRDGADLHVHRHHSDLFYVLAGELTLRLGPDGAPTTVPAGTLVAVPPLVVHGFRNASPDAELRYLNMHAPGCGFADYMRALGQGRRHAHDQHDPPPDGGRSPEDVVIGGPPPVLDGPITVTEIDVDEHATVAAPDPARLTYVYVLEGEIVLDSRHGEVGAPAGAFVRVPPDAAASAPVAVDGPARALWIEAQAGTERTDSM